MRRKRRVQAKRWNPSSTSCRHLYIVIILCLKGSRNVDKSQTAPLCVWGEGESCTSKAQPLMGLTPLSSAPSFSVSYLFFSAPQLVPDW